MQMNINKKLLKGAGIALLIFLIALIILFIYFSGFNGPKYGTPAEHGVSYKVE